MSAQARIFGLAALAALAACQRPPTPATSVTTPISPPAAAASGKASGLWVERVTERGRVSVTRLCLDAAAAQQLAALGGRLSGRCHDQSVTASDAGGWRFKSRCDMGAWGKVATDGVAQGDFARDYHVDALAETSGAAETAADGPRHVKADIRWQGACPKDMQAGEVVWPDGRRSRLSQLGAAS